MAVLPNALETVFHEIEDRTEPFSEYDVSAALQTFRKNQEEAGHDTPSELLAESMAFDFCEDYHHEETGWGTYYGPMMVGKEFEHPSIQLVTSDILEYWQARSKEAIHPLLCLRYADLVWDFSLKIRERTADICCAQIVVDSSVELATKQLFERVTNVRDKLERSLSIALSINDKERVKCLATAIIALEDNAAEIGKLGTWGFGFDLLIENKKVPLSEDQERKVIDQLETYLAQAATLSGDSGYPLDHFAAQRAAVRLARYYDRNKKCDDVRRVLSLYAAAVKAIAKKAMAMLGVSWLREVYDVLVQYGVKDEADSVAVLMRELGRDIRKEMASTTHTIEFSKEEVAAYIASMMSGTEDEVVARICQTFIPDSNKIEQRIHDMASRSVLWDLFDTCLIDEEGREISRVGSVKDDPEGRIVWEMSQDMGLERPWLGLALQEWVNRFEITADHLLERLQRSPLFPKDRHDLLKSGVDAHLRKDYFASIHILVPQIEHAFRSLLVATGQSTYKPGRHGGLNLKVLNDLLRDPVTTLVFGEDCVRYFKVLLTDPRGWNLRNNVCHGLINTPSSNPVLSDRLIHLLLILSMARHAGDKGDDSQQSHSVDSTPRNPADL